MKTIISVIETYLELDSIGALLIDGKWGCGKTYFFNNEVKPYLEDKGKVVIMVSLFGASSLTEIRKEIFCSYIDKANMRKSRKFKFFKYLIRGSEIIDKSEFVKSYINLSDLLDSGNFLINLIKDRDKIVLCFDDFERHSKSLLTEDLLGFINDLLETYKLKIIIIANEEKIGTERLRFKEKVIAKEVRYKSDIQSVLAHIIKKYNHDDFSNFMLEFMDLNNFLKLQPIEKNGLFGRLIEDSSVNIRLWHYIIEHFYYIFKRLLKEDELNLQWGNKLKNIFCFVYSITIVYKTNYVNYYRRYGLDHADSKYNEISWEKNPMPSMLTDLVNRNLITKAQKYFFDLEHAGIKRVDPENGFQKHEYLPEDKYSQITDFLKYFNICFYGDQHEIYIYYPDIYDFIVAGYTIDFARLRELILEEFEIHKDDPNKDLINKYSTYQLPNVTNKEFQNDINILYKECSFGKVENANSFMYLCYYFITYHIILNKETTEIKKDMIRGIDLFFAKSSDNYYCLREEDAKMAKVRVQLDDFSDILDYISKKFEEFKSVKIKNKAKELESLFDESIEKCVVKLIPDPYSYDRKKEPLTEYPVLKYFSQDIVHKKIVNIEPFEARYLLIMIEGRYYYLVRSKEELDLLKPEIVFLEYLCDDLSNFISNDNIINLSQIIIKDELIPAVYKAIKILKEEYIEERKPWERLE